MNKPDTQAQQKLIMVADDDQIVRMVLSEMLEQLGYEVVTATDGEEALDLFTKSHNKIHLVILDYKMPKLSGEELFGELKKLSPGVKVLLSSGYNESDNIDGLLRDGLCGLLPKPFSLTQIRDVVARILKSDCGT